MKIINYNLLNDGDIILFHQNKSCFGKCIQLCTSSKFSHIGMVLKNPTYIDPDLNGGLYLIESGLEPYKDEEDKQYKLGVQIQKLLPILKEYGRKNIYCRRLSKLGEFPKNKMKEIHKTIYNKPYDLNLIDWVEGLIDVKAPIFNKKTTDRFWCSALIAYIYLNIGYLRYDTSWTLINPEDWNDKSKTLNFTNCNLGKVERIYF